MKNRFLIYLFAIVLFTSCHTSKEILYFQDIAVNQPEAIVGARDITVQPSAGRSGNSSMAFSPRCTVRVTTQTMRITAIKIAPNAFFIHKSSVFLDFSRTPTCR